MKTIRFKVLALLCALVQGAWAQTTVTTDQARRNAITGGANIKLGANIDLSNSTLNIAGGTVTIDLNGYTLDRKPYRRRNSTGATTWRRSCSKSAIIHATARHGTVDLPSMSCGHAPGACG